MNSKQINNGHKFPMAVKSATLRDWKRTKNGKPALSASTIAAERNMSQSTVTRWAAAAGLQRPQHPNTVAAHARRKAANAQTRAFNTPTVQENGTLLFRGTAYIVAR